jgi:predicted dehydrogenase
MIEAAVVGLGRVGMTFADDPLRRGVTTHAEAWHRHPMASLVAGVDPDPLRRSHFTDRYGVPAYASLGDLLAVRVPQVVSVCVPPERHAEVTVQAIEGGVQRVVCEKPCTGSLAEARDLLGALGSSADRVGVNFTRRFDPLHKWLFGVVARDRLVAGHGYYTGGLANTASHWLASLLCAGASVEKVMALPSPTAPDSPTLNAVMAGGATVCLQGGAVGDFMAFEMTFYTASHKIRIWHSGARAELESASPSSRYSEYRELQGMRFAPPLGLSNSQLAVVEDAVESLLDNRPMACTVFDALAVHAVMAAAWHSLDSGGWEVVDDRLGG